MKRSLKVSLVVNGEESHLQVTEQSETSVNFGNKGDGYEFLATNGVRLRSAVRPEFRKVCNILYVRGSFSECDDCVVTIPTSMVGMVLEAIAEYNAFDFSDGLVCVQDMKDGDVGLIVKWILPMYKGRIVQRRDDSLITIGKDNESDFINIFKLPRCEECWVQLLKLEGMKFVPVKG